MDVTARLLAKYVEKVSGDKILVNNRTGGGGMVGHTWLATQAKNDGQQLGLKSDTHWPERIGIRLGAGAYASGEHDALAGAGLQLEAWTLWGLYSWRDDTFVVDLVNAHQRTDKGFGPALGPAATACAGTTSAPSRPTASVRRKWEVTSG